MSQSSSYETIDLIENYLLMKTAWYLIFSRSTIQARDGHDRVIDYSGGDRVGVLGSGPPHFLAVWGSTCTWTPPLLPPCSGCQQALAYWQPFSCWSCYVTVRIIKPFTVQLNVRPAYMSCYSGESLAGFKLPFPCTHISAPTVVGATPYHGSLFTRLSPQSQSSGGEHQHSPMMGTRC